MLWPVTGSFGEPIMFDFFKRFVGLTANPPVRPARRRPRKRTSEPVMTGAIPAPEVVEGNDHTDWDLWEDSVNALDSQMQSLSPSARLYASKRTASQFDDLDVFSRVGKNREI
jgi:hypothetical protein